MKLRISGDKLTIACAHMLSKHDKCARVHGHNYQIEVEIEGELNESNMIIDFSLFKKGFPINKLHFREKHSCILFHLPL